MVRGIVGDKIDWHFQGIFDIQPQTAELEQRHDAAFFDFQIYVAVTARRAILEYEPNRLTLRSPCACAIGVMIFRNSSIVYGICVTSQCFSDPSITVFFKKYNRKEFER